MSANSPIDRIQRKSTTLVQPQKEFTSIDQAIISSAKGLEHPFGSNEIADAIAAAYPQLLLNVDELPCENQCSSNGFSHFEPTVSNGGALVDTQSCKYPMRGFDDQLDAPEEDLGSENKKPGRFACCRKRCFLCLKRLRPPTWVTRTLLTLYTWTGGALTYALLIAVVYTTIMSLRPSLALPPECRRIAVPLPEIGLPSGTNKTMTTIVPGQKEPDELPDGFHVGLECRHGEALSVLIFYAFGFVVGEMMELVHLPGLFGMLLGGLALRNIGTLLIAQNIYHQNNIPNGSYALGVNNSMIPENISKFTVTDRWSQLAALLIVNPNLSGVLRQLALTTILTRAGLGIDPSTLKQVCGSVFRLAMIPCLSEAAALTLVTRFLIGWPWAWGAILGFACAAVSPAVIVPNMMRLEVTGWGVAEGIPTLVVAASSLDDVLAITGFGVALAVALSTGDNLVATVFWGPAEALCGAAFGVGVGSLLCLLPPPKLEHSHLIRGILLVCMAITGLVGSVGLHLPGAGALACLTLAFIVAMGWRAGFPWRLTQPEETYLPDTSDVLNKNISSCPVNSDPDGSQNTYGTMENTTVPQSLAAKQADNSATCENNSTKSDVIRDREETTSMPEAGITGMRNRRHKESINSNILETLIEYHPYYCSILRQEYNNQLPRSNPSRGTSVHSSVKSKLSFRPLTGGDLPAIAVAVAATAARTGSVRRNSGNNASVPITFIRNRPRASRRFSLPEPTAHYEMDAFSVPGSSRRGMSPPSDRSSFRQGFHKNRRRILSPTFREQYAAMYNQPVDKIEELVECEDDFHAANKSCHFHGVDDQNYNARPETCQLDLRASGQDELFSRPATPRERGLACLNSMRQTLAAVWWFVQPILFSLIGAEVNLATLGGSSTGRGVACLIIAVLVRMVATIVAVLPSKLNMRERLFVAFSWLPKATVQAAIGPVALDTARQLHSSAEIIGYGQVVLTLAAMSIILTAPIGAILMPITAPYLLHQDLSASEVMTARTRRTTPGKSNSNPTQKCNSSPEETIPVTTIPATVPNTIPQKSTNGANPTEQINNT